MEDLSRISPIPCLTFLVILVPGCFQDVGGQDDAATATDTEDIEEPGDTIDNCGDGVQDPGEGCDLGSENDDAGACKSDCTPQACGDGFVGPGESCDDGNGVTGDGCTASCALESCGNGKVDAGEECDDGNLSNGDDCLNTCVAAFCGDGYLYIDEEECEDGNFSNLDDCTNECFVAKCGDGHTWLGVEQCDDANVSNSDACLNSCEQAVCGDGHIKAGSEECDDGNVAGDDGCDAACVLEIKYVFVSGAQFNGNLGGIEGADQKCQTLAEAANLAGAYYAWVSDAETSPALRFTKSTTPYKLVDGTVIADSWVELTDGPLKHAIDRTETGAVIEWGPVWTATDSSGVSAGLNCLSWMSSSNDDDGRAGDATSAAADWTYDVNERCDSLRRLYCFRQ